MPFSKLRPLIETLGTKSIKIDIDFLQKMVNRSIHRSAFFMGIGVHAADRKDFLDYKLTDRDQLAALAGQISSVVIPDLSDEKILEGKSEFRRWIIGNGFSEFIHNYSIFLDELYSVYLLVELANDEDIKKNTHNSADKKQEYITKENNFRKNPSVSSKLKILHEEFSVPSSLSTHIQGLSISRNCLIHNNGIVDKRHCNAVEKTHLEVTWRGLSIFSENEKGERKPIEIGQFIEGGSSIAVGFLDRKRAWSEGEIVDFTPQDIYEILQFAGMDSREMLKHFADYCRNNGVKNTPGEAQAPT